MRLLNSVLYSVVGLTIAQNAIGSAFQLREGNSGALGTAMAGSAVLENDIAAITNNPATMGTLKKSGIAVNGTAALISNHFRYGSASNTLGGPLTTIEGSDGGDFGGTFLIPGAHMHWMYDKNLSFGLSGTAPFGLGTKYTPEWIGRYYAIKSELRTMDVNLSANYKLHHMIYVAGGISSQYAKATLTKAIPNSLAVPGAADGDASVSGNANSFGFNLGAFFKPSEELRLGAHYRSNVKHELQGTSIVSGSRLSENGKTSIFTDLDIPDVVTFSGAYQIDKKWAVMATAEWTKWSRLKEIVIKRKADSSKVETEEFNYKSTWFFSLGGTYQLNEHTLFKAGFAHDSTPSNDEDRSARLPDSDRMWFSLGMDYHVSDVFKAAFNYTYLSAKDAEINLDKKSDALRKVLKGKVENTTHLVGGKIQYSF